MLALTVYYHKFIPGYVYLVRSLTQLTCKTVTFIWMDQYHKAFELLKEALMKSLIMDFPDPNKLYTLFSDTSKYVWCAVSAQDIPLPLTVKLYVTSMKLLLLVDFSIWSLKLGCINKRNLCQIHFSYETVLLSGRCIHTSRKRSFTCKKFQMNLKYKSKKCGCWTQWLQN